MTNELMMMLASNAFTLITLIAVLKNEIKWLKRLLTDHENRLRKIEQGKHRSVELSELSEFGV